MGFKINSSHLVGLFCWRSKMARPISKLYGVGINDVDYITQPSYVDETGKRIRLVCPFYASWRRMLERVYSEREKIRSPGLVGNSVNEQWHYLSTFKSWMESQTWEGLELDKDILLQGNKHYSSENCAFVPDYLNTLFGYQQGWRKEYPFGVSKRPDDKVYSRNWTKPYSARCCIGNNQEYKHVGYFTNPADAHKAWQEKKSEQIEITIGRYQLELCYREDVEQSLRKRVNQLRYEIDNNLETTFL